jgi:hypothetical protein
VEDWHNWKPPKADQANQRGRFRGLHPCRFYLDPLRMVNRAIPSKQH